MSILLIFTCLGRAYWARARSWPWARLGPIGQPQQNYKKAKWPSKCANSVNERETYYCRNPQLENSLKYIQYVILIKGGYKGTSLCQPAFLGIWDIKDNKNKRISMDQKHIKGLTKCKWT